MCQSTVTALQYFPNNPNNCSYCAIRSAHLEFKEGSHDDSKPIKLCIDCITVDSALFKLGIKTDKDFEQLEKMCLDHYNQDNWKKVSNYD